MSAPVFLLEPELAARAREGGSLDLVGPEGRHAASVRRIRAGEPIELVDGLGRRIVGRVTGVERSGCTIAVERIVEEPPEHPRITAVQAIAKGDRGELAVQMMTEAGVDSVIPWQAEHSVARWEGDRAVKHRDRWALTAQEAAKQARRAWVPTIGSPIASAAVADLIANAGVALVLDERSTVPITSIDFSTAHDVIVIIGPEGGLSENERTMFEDAGADLVRLGSTVLRTSTAGVVALGVVMARVGRW